MSSSELFAIAAIAAIADKPLAPKGRRTLQADTLAASVVILLVVTVVQRSVGFGRGMLFCRWLTPEALGEWEMVYSFLLLAAPLAVLGVPGSFGRYAEHYRQRGHLRTFLNRTAAWTAACTAAAIVLVMCFNRELSIVVFGDAQYAPLMRNIGLCLGTIVLHHTLTALLTAIRLYRVVSLMNFGQSLLFAVTSLALIWRDPGMTSILYGYAAACLIASVGALAWAWPALREIDRPDHRLQHGQFWGKLLKFAFYVWVTNLLTHLFAVVDRTMLMHCAGHTPAEALDQIGQYHSSRIIPLLMVSVADLLAGLVMPHLSHDWETGRREHASARLNLAIKLTSLGMLAFGACVLAAAPLLFGVVLQGRYDDGLAVLPWTLTGCVWYGIYIVAQCYLWCVEKTRLTTVPLVVGLVANILLNFLLLPAYGLHGAVVSTAVASCICLAIVLELSRRHGMRVDAGTWLAAMSPVALGLGAWPAAAACGLLVFATLGTQWVLTLQERLELTNLAAGALHKSLAMLRPRDQAIG